MAWNEPGGNDKDPWGNRGDQGPPDLDEVFRKAQDRLSGIFGGGGSGGGKGGGGLSYGLIGALVVVGLLLYAFSGIYQVDQKERGVVFRFGKAQDELVMPGLHWNPPLIDKVEQVNVTNVYSHQHQALMLTEDENIVDINMSVQYIASDPRAYLVNVRSPENSLSHATESALRHVVGSSTMDSVITDGRAAIALEVQQRLQNYLDLYGAGITVSTVNIDQSAPPAQVKDAFDDVQKAKEDEQRYINQANALAEQIIPEARGDAAKQVEQANAYRDQVIARAEGEAERFKKLLTEYAISKRVTRDRLYIDALEKVLSQSSKVMVDVEGGNNMLYLPLDRMTQNNSPARVGNESSVDSVRDASDAILRELNDRVTTNRRRDTR